MILQSVPSTAYLPTDESTLNISVLFSVSNIVRDLEKGLGYLPTLMFSPVPSHRVLELSLQCF